jgi:dUTP pyrophosphatase
MSDRCWNFAGQDCPSDAACHYPLRCENSEMKVGGPLSRDLTHTFQVKRESPSATMPVRATPGSIGYDVCADLPAYPNGLLIPAGCRKLVPLGFSMACPPNTYGRLAPRSGLSVKKGIHIMAGVVDPDYRGIVQALLLNTGHDAVVIQHGERCAQLILEHAVVAPVVLVDNLPDTARGNGGFGSTG